MIALETLTGMNTRLATEDIFNRMFIVCVTLRGRFLSLSLTAPSEALVTVNPHLAMQRKLNIN